MSEDEKMVLVFSVMIAVGAWALWYRDVVRARRFTGPRPSRRLIAWVPLIALLALVGVLRTMAASDVRDAPQYLLMYTLLGAAWLGVAALSLPWLGLSPWDDALERGNTAAACAISGALLGQIACYAGGNVGDGPGWWVVVFSAILAGSAWVVLWIIVGRFTRVADAITIDRDLAAGIRVAGLLAANGLILGAATAGDWQSVDQTVVDFARCGWPALFLAVGALITEPLFRPESSRSPRSTLIQGGGPALFYGIVAVATWFSRSPR